MTSNDLALDRSDQQFKDSEPTVEAPTAYSPLKLWAYRVAVYLLLSFVDDPAWLAFMFC